MSENGSSKLNHNRPDPQHQLAELAKTIWLEAAGEGYCGMLAVGQVIMHRVADIRWPNTPERVVHDPYQFSCHNLDARTTEWRNARCRNMIQMESYADAWRAAAAAYFGTEPDLTDGACHYLAARVKDDTYWAEGKTPCAEIGNHLFFNDVA
mgnify:CR=1 FL=1|tara:strand:- start:5500 stop:5955 length:456 start_codon:yes stop_codon:yes gene_type:complete